MLSPPFHIREILNANRNTAGIILGFMHLMGRDGDIAAVEDAARDYLRLMDHTMRTMACVFPPSPSMGGESRLPKGTIGSPDEYFELLDFAVEIEAINIKRLLRDHPELSVETQEMMLEQARGAIDILGRYARWVRSTIKSRFPDLWTDVHDEKYKNYLAIKPQF